MITIRWKILGPNEGATLCATCTWGLVRSGYRAEEAETFCRMVGPNARVPFAVRECSAYTDRRAENAAGRAMGFAPAITISETKEEATEIAPVAEKPADAAE